MSGSHESEELLAPMATPTTEGVAMAPTVVSEAAENLVIADASPKSKPRKMLGIILIVLANFVFSVVALMIRFSGKEVPVFEQVFFRCLAQLIGTGMALGYYRLSPVLDRRTTVIMCVRSLCAIANMCTFFWALRLLSVADTQSIFFVSSLLTGIGGRMFLNEAFGLFEIIAAVCTFGGMVLVTQPHFIFGGASTGQASVSVSQRYFGVSLCLIGATTGSISLLMIRGVGTRVHYQVVGFYFSAMAVLIMPIAVALQGVVVPREVLTYIELFLMGFLGTVGQMLLNKGVQLEDAIVSNLLNVLNIVFGLLWSIFFLSDGWNVWSVLGAAVISVSVLAVGVKRHQRKRMASSPVAFSALPPSAAELSDSEEYNECVAERVRRDAEAADASDDLAANESSVLARAVAEA